MDWAAKVKLMRQAVTEATVITGRGADSIREYFLDMLHLTDDFHPFTTDRAMSPKLMDHELVYDMFCEVGDLIGQHFAYLNDPSFAVIVFDADAATDTFFKLVDKHPS